MRQCHAPPWPGRSFQDRREPIPGDFNRNILLLMILKRPPRPRRRRDVAARDTIRNGTRIETVSERSRQ